MFSELNPLHGLKMEREYQRGEQPTGSIWQGPHQPGRGAPSEIWLGENGKKQLISPSLTFELGSGENPPVYFSPSKRKDTINTEPSQRNKERVYLKLCSVAHKAEMTVAFHASVSWVAFLLNLQRGGHSCFW